MAKYLKKKKKKKPVALIVVLVLVVVIALAAIALFALPQILYKLSGDADAELGQTDSQSIQEADGPKNVGPAMEFPLLVDDGRLEIDSLFPFSGINPDCNNQEGENIASIRLKNTSDTYLADARISLTLTDGTQLNFTVTELPSGRSIMAFSTENLSIPADAVCAGAACEAVYDDTGVTTSDKVAVSVSGVTVTLTNTSGKDLSEIVVYCRSILGEDSFGGITYKYTVTDLPAGESTTVDATDCVIGMAEVVRLAVN